MERTTMPQCPTCKTPYELGQRYCQTCESYLLDLEKGDYFCPQCGIRVAPGQEVCHKCNASLVEPAAAPAGAAPAAPTSGPAPTPSGPPPHLGETMPPPRSLPLWVPGTLIAAGFIIVILLAVIFSRPGEKATTVAEPPTTSAPATTPGPTAITPSQPSAVTPTPQATTPPAAGTTPVEKPAAAISTETTPPRSREEIMKEEVRETLNNLKKAQINQDIILFMSCYSYLYPSLDKKRKQTLAYWSNFRYLDLEFSLDEIKPLGPDSLLAHVTWNMQVQNRKSHEFQSSTQIFEVALGKELGVWRIRSLKDVSDYEEEE
ncbi:MAG: double zinc ribbon domain-containing protein [Desulfobaccales bacterium]